MAVTNIAYEGSDAYWLRTSVQSANNGVER